MRLKRHPGYATLNRFADGELDPGRHRRVATHLAECSRCRQEVAFIRQAGELARSLDTPPLPEGALERILERRAEGDRVILPLEPAGAPAPPSRLRGVATAAAAVVAVFVVGLLASTQLLEADRPTLRVDPERPRAGDTVVIEYDGGQRFAREDYLKLRARYRTASGLRWQQIAGMLARDGDLFRAPLALPDSVVYVAFAVEDLRASEVDSRNRELWEVVVHDDEGRPTVGALGERAADLLGRDELEGLRAARAITELYPESPRGWAWRWVYESMVADSDSLRAWHRAKLRELEAGMASDPPADPEELAHLAWHAIQLGDWASADFWTREAERRGARSVYLYQAKAIQLLYSERPDPASALRELEALWDAAPGPVTTVADAGWSLATGNGDWQAAMRWLPRRRAARGDLAADRILDDLESGFGPRRTLEWAMANLEDVLLRPSDNRNLTRPLDLHRRRLDAERQRTLASMARMALAVGRTSVASGLAIEAVPLAWETGALETLGSVLLEAGDTAYAVTAFARAAADPMGNAPPEAVVQTARWEQELEAARYALTRHVLRTSVIVYLPDELQQTGGPGVTGFVLGCGPSDARVEEITDLMGGAPLTMYSVAPPSIGSATVEGCGLSVPLERDSTGDVGRAFGVRGYPTFFVTDAQGRIRFEHSALDEIPRQLQALRRGPRPPVVD